MSVRLANRQGRACVLVGDAYVDVEHASNGRFPVDAMAILQRWDAFVDWAGGLGSGHAEGDWRVTDLSAPVPRPAKVYGVGLNYRDHAEEARLPIPATPIIFTKFPNCITGPAADVELSSNYVDWEVELVVVVGRGGRGIDEARAFEHVAGYCVGQDISDRKVQFADTPPQFSMGKSFDSFGPIGPAVVTLDGLADPNDLALTCSVGDELMQNGRSANMVFSVAAMMAFLSRRCTLEPGDLIFTGTPAGVGSGRSPRRYLQPDEIITSRIEGIGELRNRCVAAHVN